MLLWLSKAQNAAVRKEAKRVDTNVTAVLRELIEVCLSEKRGA
jgi:hypothetical protein